MPVPVNGTFADIIYSAQLLDVSTASLSYMPIMKAGRVIDAKIALSAAITGADSIVTVKKYPEGVSANTVTIGTITLSNSGSAAGKVYSLSITGTEAARTVADGDVLVFDTDGASSTTSIGYISAEVRGP